MQVLESLPDGAVLCAPSGIVLWSNNAAAGLLRAERADIQRQPLSRLVQRPGDAQQLEAMLREVASDGVPRELNVRVPREDAKNSLLELRASLASPHSQPAEAILVLVRDFTQQAEQRVQVQMYASELGLLFREARGYSRQVESLYAVTKLLNSEMELGEMLHKALDMLGSFSSQKLTLAVALKDPGRVFRIICSCGPRGRAIKAASIPAGKDSSLVQLFKERGPLLADDKRPPPQSLAGLMSQAEARSMAVLPLATKNKRVGLLLYLSPRSFSIAQRDLPFYQGVAESLAVAIERAQLYGIKKQQLAQARELDETKRNLMAALTHDFRTPITALQTSAALLGELEPEAAGNEHARRLLAVIKRSVARMDRLVSDLLDANKLQTSSLKLDVRDVRLEEMIREVANLLPLDSAQRMKLKAPAGGIGLLGDPVRLRQALSNIIDNSFKYSPPGEEVLVDLKITGNHAVVVVSDRGPGVPREERKKIFEPFYRLERDRGHNGSGLGLAISKWLIELHGGKVWVQSRPGGGSRFNVVFPVGGPG